MNDGSAPNPDPTQVKARILFAGDVVGSTGRRTLLTVLPRLRERMKIDFVVVNGENAAGGHGITSKIAREMLAAGVDVITLGNHSYRQREVYRFLDEEQRILRPTNFLRGQPGHGSCVVTNADGSVRLGVVSVCGNLYINAPLPAFSETDAALRTLRGAADHILVDIHAEATSEKVGLGWYLDGRVTAVVGTHTHVPTADARVLPGGTAYITDVGMTGARGGVLGVERQLAVDSLLTRMPVHFESSDDDPWLQGALIECSDQPMRAASIVGVQEPL
ncbi:MAG: TIGR00282 family metallophosphoesterase [Solirubrobacteraceae bacterium]